MKKHVVLSLVAMTSAPLAALADANLTDKIGTDVKDWVAEGGKTVTINGTTITSPTGATVTHNLGKLLPGKYKLTLASSTNAVVTINGKAAGTAFDYDGTADMVITIKANTAGTAVTATIDKLELVYDFRAFVAPLREQLVVVANSITDATPNRQAYNDRAQAIAAKLAEIEGETYAAYEKYELYKEDNTTAATIAAEIEALGEDIKNANDHYTAFTYASGKVSTLKTAYATLTTTYNAAEKYTKTKYSTEFTAIGNAITEFENGVKAHETDANDHYPQAKADELYTTLNGRITTLTTNIATANQDDADYIIVKGWISDANTAYSQAVINLTKAMPQGSVYDDWRNEALVALAEQDKAIKAVATANGTDAAHDNATESKEANSQAIANATTAIASIVDEYIKAEDPKGKVVLSKERYDAAIAEVATLQSSLNGITDIDEVKAQFTDEIAAIQTMINNLSKSIENANKNHTFVGDNPYTTTTEKTDIENAISALETAAATPIAEYNAKVAVNGAITALQNALNAAVEVVAGLKSEDEKYVASDYFNDQKKAIQTAIKDYTDGLADAVTAKTAVAYKNANLTTIQGMYAENSGAVYDYKTAATNAVGKYNTLQTALTSYNTALTELKSTITVRAVQVGQSGTPVATTVAGTTYGDRYDALKTLIDGLQTELNTALADKTTGHVNKLEVANTTNDNIKGYVTTDITALKGAYAADKAKYDEVASAQAVVNLVNLTTERLDAIQAAIDARTSADNDLYWKAEEIGLKYSELKDKLDKIDAGDEVTSIQEQKNKAANDLEDIKNSSTLTDLQKMTKLQDITNAIGEINSNLNKLDAEVATAKQVVTANKNANTALQTTITDINNNINGNASKNIKAISALYKNVAEYNADDNTYFTGAISNLSNRLTQISNNIASDLAAETLKDKVADKTVDDQLVKGYNSQLSDLLNDVKALRTEADLQKKDYDKWKAVTDKMKKYKNNKSLATIISEVKTSLSSKTDGTNLTYYQSQCDNLINTRLAAVNTHLNTERVKTPIKDRNINKDGMLNELTSIYNAANGYPTAAANDKKNNSTQNTNYNNSITRYGAVNSGLNDTELAADTKEKKGKELAAILPLIDDYKTKTDSLYAIGKTTADVTMMNNLWNSIDSKLVALENFLKNTDGAYDEAIDADNTVRYNRFIAAISKTEEAYNDAKTLIDKYLAVSNEELRADINTIIASQTDIYKYNELINNLKSTARDERKNVAAGVVYDAEEAYTTTANDYTNEIKAAVDILSSQVNANAQTVLTREVTELVEALNAAETETTFAAFEKTVKEEAFADVKELLEEVAEADGTPKASLLNSKTLIYLLDQTYMEEFGKVDEMLATGKEAAAKADWNLRINGKYTGATGTCDSKEDYRLYDGIDATIEAELTDLNNFAYRSTSVKNRTIQTYKNLVQDYITEGAKAKATEYIEAETLYDNYADVLSYVTAFISDDTYSSAKTYNDEYSGNKEAQQDVLDAIDELQTALNEAAAYMRAYHWYNETKEQGIEGLQTQIDNHKTNVQSNFNNAAANKDSWMGTCESIATSINAVYASANQEEITQLRDNINELAADLTAALAAFGADSEKGKALQALYDEECEGLGDELAGIIADFAADETPEKDQQETLLPFEKKVAAAYAKFTNAWKSELIDKVSKELTDILGQIKSERDAAAEQLAGIAVHHTPVIEEYTAELKEVNDGISAVETLLNEKIADKTVLTYSNKVASLCGVLRSDIQYFCNDLKDADASWITSDKAYDRLTTELKVYEDALDALKKKIAGLKHVDLVFSTTNANYSTYGEYYNYSLNRSVQNRINTNKSNLNNGRSGGWLTASDMLWFEPQMKSQLSNHEKMSLYDENVKWNIAHVNDVLDQVGVILSANTYKFLGEEDYETELSLLNESIRYAVNFNYDTRYGYIVTTDVYGNTIPSTTYDYINEAAGIVSARAEELQTLADELLKAVNENKYVPGDLTGTGEAGTADYTAILKAALEIEPIDKETNPTLFAAADLNGDGVINIGDVTVMANVLRGSYNPITGASHISAFGNAAENLYMSSETNGTVTRVALNLQNVKQYVGCQMDIVLPAGITLVNEEMSARSNDHALNSNDLNSNVHRIVVSNINNNVFNSGDALIYLDLNLNGQSLEKVGICNIMFTEANGAITKFDNLGNSELTGINGVNAQNGIMQKIYNMGGRVMDSIKKGINIIRKADGTTNKVVNK